MINDKKVIPTKNYEAMCQTLLNAHDLITTNKSLLWGNGVDPILRRIRTTLRREGIEFSTRTRDIEE